MLFVSRHSLKTGALSLRAVPVYTCDALLQLSNRLRTPTAACGTTYSIETIEGNITQLKAGCEHVMNSAELRTTLQMCLQAGNYLNAGTFRGQASAVDVGFLSQVSTRRQRCL